MILPNLAAMDPHVAGYDSANECRLMDPHVAGYDSANKCRQQWARMSRDTILQTNVGSNRPAYRGI